MQFRNVAPSTEMVDVMNGYSRIERDVHDQGFVALVDVMPRLVPLDKTADIAIVQAARTSYGAGTKSVSDDQSLLRFLMRHHHTGPFEQVEFKFHMALPVFVARQIVRHRTASLNEQSGSYSIIQPKFYRPNRSEVRSQSRLNKQGSSAPVDDRTAEAFLRYLDDVESLYGRYEDMVDMGVQRGLARVGLPLSMFTEWYWKIDLSNLLHFLELRMSEHALKETRDYAVAVYELIKPIVPDSIEAFEDYRLRSVTLSRPEVEALREGRELDTVNKRERAEWEEKKRLLQLHGKEAKASGKI